MYTNNMEHRLSNKSIEAMTADCAVCGPVELKRKNKGGRDTYMCRNKFNEHKRNYQRGRPLNENALNTSRTKNARRQGMDIDCYKTVWNEWSELQGGLCAICREELGYRAAIDHDHETGVIRGLLCFHCNVAIGHMRDNTDRLRAAIAYLEKGSGGNSELMGGGYE